MSISSPERMEQHVVVASDATRFEKTVLPNGIRVITESIPSVRSVAVGVWVNTGSRDEAEPVSGISHFIEHMVFKGTAKRRTYQIAQRMEAVGGFLNAFTTKEYTCYYVRALDEHTARSIDTIVDLVSSPLFPEKEMDKEKDVVVEEMKMYEDTPEELIFDRFEDVVYRGHSLGRPIIGYEESVRSLSRDDLFEYVNTGYAPGRLLLAVSGNCRHDEVVRLAEKYFAVDGRKDVPLERAPLNPYVAGEHAEERPIQQAHLVIGRRSYGIRHPKRTVLSVLNTLLGGGMSSRLNQNIRERYGFCYNIYSFANMHSDSGDFGVYMGTDAGKVERARKLILREFEKLTTTPITTRLVAQAKSQVKGAIMLGLESMSSRMTRIGRQELQLGRYYTLDEALQDLEDVTLEQVREVANELFVPDELSTVVLMPK